MTSNMLALRENGVGMAGSDHILAAIDMHPPDGHAIERSSALGATWVVKYAINRLVGWISNFSRMRFQECALLCQYHFAGAIYYIKVIHVIRIDAARSGNAGESMSCNDQTPVRNELLKNSQRCYRASNWDHYKTALRRLTNGSHKMPIVLQNAVLMTLALSAKVLLTAPVMV